MKKALFILSLLFSFASIHAQPGQGGGPRMSPEQRANDAIAGIDTKNTLTTVQKDSIIAAYKSFFNAMQANRRSNGTRDKITQFEQERNAKVKTALANETMYTQYLNFVEQEKAKRGQRGGGPGESNERPGN